MPQKIESGNSCHLLKTVAVSKPKNQDLVRE